jgi:hypothetical protein
MIDKSFRWTDDSGASLTLAIVGTQGDVAWTLTVTQRTSVLTAALTSDDVRRLHEVPVAGSNREPAVIPLVDAEVVVQPVGPWDSRISLRIGPSEAGCLLVARGLVHAINDLLGGSQG